MSEFGNLGIQYFIKTIVCERLVPRYNLNQVGTYNLNVSTPVPSSAPQYSEAGRVAPPIDQYGASPV